MKSLFSRLSYALIFSLFIVACSHNHHEDPKPPVANAGPDQNIQLPAANFTLTGSGTTTNGSITDYQWSLVSGPNNPAIANIYAASTTVGGFIQGTYIFKLLVTDEKSLSDADSVTITCIQAPEQTVTFQPSNNPNERHIWGSANQDQSLHATELDAGAWTSGGDPIAIRGALKFDLSGIPASATIVSAKLSLYSNPTPLNGNQTVANEGTDNSMYIRQITSDWIPGSTNWLNQPTTTSTNQVSIPHSSLPSLDLVDIDVTALVAAMHTNANYGFMIMLQSEVPYNLRDFCSSTYTDASKHPKLEIIYQP